MEDIVLTFIGAAAVALLADARTNFYVRVLAYQVAISVEGRYA